MAARASSTVRSADRPDSTASRRSSGSSAMKPPSRTLAGRRNRRDHRMLSTTPATSARMSRPYRMADSGMWKLTGFGAGLNFCFPGCRLGAPGMVTGAGLENTCRCRPMRMAAATATIPAPRTRMSTPRSLAGTSLSGAPWAWAAFTAAARRRTVITSRTPSITSSTRPMTTPSCRSGPFQCGALTTPRSPASPKRISSVSGTTSVQAWPGLAPGVPVFGAVVPGWRLVIASFPDPTDGPSRLCPHEPAE